MIKNSTKEGINHARRELFSKKGGSLENIPPTKDSLLQTYKESYNRPVSVLQAMKENL